MSVNAKKKSIDRIHEALGESFVNAGDVPEDKLELKGRLAIIAVGFADKKSLGEVNRALKENGYEILYPRNFMESTLIFAFINGVGYSDWMELYKDCVRMFDSSIKNSMTNTLTGSLTRKKLDEYLSRESGEQFSETGMVTSLMSNRLENCRTREDLLKYLSGNLKNFSDTREKARYYFCKYLSAFIDERCRTYLSKCSKGLKREELLSLEDLYFLKPITNLKKDAERVNSQLSYEDKKNQLENTTIMPGGIFDEFNYYYGYINIDWVELIFERFGDVDEWDESLKLNVAKAMEFCGEDPDSRQWEKAVHELMNLEAEQKKREMLLDEEYSRENNSDRKKLYQRYRQGEKYFREFLNGTRDINRETLIAFILFVSKKTKLDRSLKVDTARMNVILDNCGFEQLMPKNSDFDRFIVNFIKSSEPFILMEERLDERILSGKDFDLYKVYSKGYSHSKENEKLV